MRYASTCGYAMLDTDFHARAAVPMGLRRGIGSAAPLIMCYPPAQNSGVCPVSGLLGAPGTQMGNTAKLLSCRCGCGPCLPPYLAHAQDEHSHTCAWVGVLAVAAASERSELWSVIQCVLERQPMRITAQHQVLPCHRGHVHAAAQGQQCVPERFLRTTTYARKC